MTRLLSQRDAEIGRLQQSKADREGPGSLAELVGAKVDKDAVHSIRSKLGDLEDQLLACTQSNNEAS